jgi:DNA-binding transcriptional MocR family regulator
VQAWIKANEEIVEWVRPDGGAICCVRLKPQVFDDAAVDGVYRTLESLGVRVSNGSWFGDEACVFRLGFAHMPVPALTEALTTLSEALKKVAHTQLGNRSTSGATTMGTERG